MLLRWLKSELITQPARKLSGWIGSERTSAVQGVVPAVRWEILPMFGKPTIGNNQQRWDSAALGRTSDCESFRCIAKPTIAGAAPWANPWLGSNPGGATLCESGHQNPKGAPSASPAPISQESVVAGQDLNVRKLGDPSERNPRAPLAQIVQRTRSYKIVFQRGKAQFWCPGGGIEPPTLRFSGSFFASTPSNLEHKNCLIVQRKSMSYLGFV